MIRRPGRFLAATIILTFVSILVVYLGGIIDGTVKGGTGALRAQPAQVLVFSDQARTVISDSRMETDLRARVEGLPGVTAVGGLGVTQLGARLPDAGPRDLIDVAVFGYELSSDRLPSPPAPGSAYADASLRDVGIRDGMTVLLGPNRTEVTIIGFVTDTAFDGQGTLWTSLDTWRTIQNENRPAKAVGTSGQQVLAVTSTLTTNDLKAAIDTGIGGTQTVTSAEAVAGLPGVEGTRGVFSAVIAITTFVGAVIIALLFALLVTERVSLYGVLKALGVRSTAILGSLALQATAIAIVAVALGTGLGLTLGRMLTSGPSAYTLTTSRAVVSASLVIVASLVGAAITLRRVLRIDPASAIGSTT
jgi:putative ABC transport system permease protein